MTFDTWRVLVSPGKPLKVVGKRDYYSGDDSIFVEFVFHEICS